MWQLREPNKYRRERDSDSDKWWIDFSHWVDREVCGKKCHWNASDEKYCVVGGRLCSGIVWFTLAEQENRQPQQAQIIRNALHIEVTSPVLENTYLQILLPYFVSTMQFTGHVYDL